jgi:hypothetical protein
VSRPLVLAFLACNKNVERFREDPSFIYRCENMAAALERQGHRVVCEHYSRFVWRKPLDVVVFHRPQFSSHFWLLSSLLQKKGVRLVADLDDLIFDPSLAGVSPAVLNHRLDEGLIAKRFKKHQRALQRFQHFTVSTTALKEELGRLPGLSAAAAIHVVPNGVHHSWPGLARGLDPVDSAPVIRYLPGTRSHDRDFAQIAEPLTQLLRERPHLRLEVCGPVDFELSVSPRQILRQGKRPFESYHEVVRGALANLAPLEATRFTRCKSALKVMEAAFWSVPTVCSPLPDAERLTDAGAFFARTPAAWHAQLALLVDAPAFHALAVDRLRERVMVASDVHRIALHWLEMLRPPRRAAEGSRLAA